MMAALPFGLDPWPYTLDLSRSPSLRCCSLPCRPPSLDSREHTHCIGTHAADDTTQPMTIDYSARPRCLPAPSRHVSLLASAPQCVGRPCRPLAGSFPTRSVWTRPTSRPLIRLSLATARVFRVFPTSKSYRAGTGSRPPNGPSALRVGAIKSRGCCLVDAAQQAGVVVSKQPLNHPCLFMFPT